MGPGQGTVPITSGSGFYLSFKRGKWRSKGETQVTKHAKNLVIWYRRLVFLKQPQANNLPLIFFHL